MSHMLHHISLGFVSIERAVEFYDRTLAPLGYGRVWSDLRPGQEAQAVGYGLPGGADELAIKPIAEGSTGPVPGLHVALAAETRAAVTAFHAAALMAGGIDDGPPGVREHYGPDYFAAFVVDPEGHRLEAVCGGAAQCHAQVEPQRHAARSRRR
jgi:catechol 2,3-dioxygenase-like lactoylglutathione lyase family enzyme